MMTKPILLDRNKMLKDLQDALKEAKKQFADCKDQNEQIYLTGMIHIIEDMIKIIASGVYEASEEE